MGLDKGLQQLDGLKASAGRHCDDDLEKIEFEDNGGRVRGASRVRSGSATEIRLVLRRSQGDDIDGKAKE